MTALISRTVGPRPVAILALFLSLSCWPAARGDEPARALQPGALFLSVQNEATKEPLAGVKVIVTFRGKTEPLKEATTDAQGRIFWNSLPGQFGQYDLRVSQDGYTAPRTATALQVDLVFGQPGVVRQLLMRPVATQDEIVTFHFSRGNKTLKLSFADRAADLPQAQADQGMAIEETVYKPAGYWRAADNTTVKPDNSALTGYSIGTNVPTYRQLCGPFALSPLIGGPYSMQTDTAWALVDKFKEPEPTEPKLKAPQQGDIIAFRKDNVLKHFAFVSKPVRDRVIILSKDGEESVWEGYADTFPKDYGSFTRYRVNWDAIDVTRAGDPQIAVPGGVDWAPKPDSWGRLPKPVPMRDRDRKAIVEALTQIVGPIALAGLAPAQSGTTADDRGGTWGTGGLQRTQSPKSTMDIRWQLQLEQRSDFADAAAAWNDLKRFTYLEEQKLDGEAVMRIKPGTNKATAVQPSFSTNDGVTWRCGWWIIKVDRSTYRGGEGLSDALFGACQAADKKEVERMFSIVKRQAQANQIDKPERPAGFPGRRK